MGMILNIGLNIIFIPKYKAVGSAMSSLITQSLMALIQIFIAYRKFQFRINYLLITRILIYSICLFTAGYFVRGVFQGYWMHQFAFYCCLALFATLITGLIRPAAILRTLTKTQEI
jgi:peptidoglycan biosynthesis protein MviN/MurJ (putative lipid II flippase)